MNNNKRAVLNFRDAIIIVCLIFAAAAAIILPKLSDSGGYAVITCGGEAVAELSLKNDGEYSFPQIKGMIFRISDGRISIAASGCKNQICVNSREIFRTGEVIVCMPNKTAVEIRSKLPHENKLDVILR